MKMPGFTAEASLNETRAQFQVKFATTVSAEAGSVKASVHYPCWLHCQECSPSNIWACQRCFACRSKGSNVVYGY